MRRVLFWLPIALWLAVELYLFRLVLLNCYGSQPKDCPDTAGAMLLWGLPSSVLLELVLYPFALALGPSSPLDSIAGQIAQLLLCGVAGLIQWYFIMRGVELLLKRLHRRLHPTSRGAA
jgi:hypothetical protein